MTRSPRPPPGLRATLVEDDQGAMLVLSYPLESRSRVPARLTSSEEQVLSLLLGGVELRGIAERRGVSVATVRKQLEAIYKKLGVHSQGELAALVKAGGPR